MSEQKHNGGPAFPHLYNGVHPDNGMSLRDWFAGQAAAQIIGGLASAQVGTGKRDAEGIAEAAYTLADAMLAARGESQ